MYSAQIRSSRTFLQKQILSSNDLDLRVYPPNTPAAALGDPNFPTAAKPWILNPDLNGETAAARSAAATPGDDSINNVEQVVIENPTPGAIYHIGISHKGTLFNNSPQWMSVGISGREVPTSHNFAVTQFFFLNGVYNVVFNSILGGVYALQTSTDLQNWTTLGGELSARSDSTATSFPPLGPSGFARLIRLY